MDNPVDRSNTLSVNGTMIWYYYICHRQVWLIAHHITPDEDDSNIRLGRHISEQAYQRDRKEINLGHVKLDIISNARDGGVVVAEVKKSSRYLQSARMQLLLYLQELESKGVPASGELRIPEERRRMPVQLGHEEREELDRAKRDVLRIVYLPRPPEAKKIQRCKSCAYREFCWA